MKKTILKIAVFIGGLLILVVAVNFLFSKQIKQTANTIQPVRLKTLDNFYDFGSLPIKVGKESYSFKIMNISQEPVEISKFYTSCRCATANLIINGENVGEADFLGKARSSSVEILLPNQTAVVEVIFDPTIDGPNGVGVRESFVYLENKDGAPLRLGVRALVTL
ncbi:MAG: DUF1573 domain-containing protein [bacterium]|nr:DUF1573 domain-containing protein [bacterium]